MKEQWCKVAITIVLSVNTIVGIIMPLFTVVYFKDEINALIGLLVASFTFLLMELFLWIIAKISIMLLIVVTIVITAIIVSHILLKQYRETSINFSSIHPDNQHPPRFAAYLLRFLPRTQRAALLGDLEEEYWEIHDQRGRRQAGVWYWGQTITSLGPLLWRAVCTLLRENMPGWFGAIIRRFIP